MGSTSHVLDALLHWGRNVLGNSAGSGSQNRKVVVLKLCIMESMPVSMAIKVELKC